MLVWKIFFDYAYVIAEKNFWHMTTPPPPQCWWFRDVPGQGGEYFHETFVRHHSNLTKYIEFIVFLWFM
jgi:hypothetical protein